MSDRRGPRGSCPGGSSPPPQGGAEPRMCAALGLAGAGRLWEGLGLVQGKGGHSRRPSVQPDVRNCGHRTSVLPASAAPEATAAACERPFLFMASRPHPEPPRVPVPPKATVSIGNRVQRRSRPPHQLALAQPRARSGYGLARPGPARFIPDFNHLGDAARRLGRTASATPARSSGEAGAQWLPTWRSPNAARSAVCFSSCLGRRSLSGGGVLFLSPVRSVISIARAWAARVSPALCASSRLL